MRAVSRPIPSSLYKKIHRVLPLVCVDLVVRDRSRKSFLLIKRANEPEIGKWWFPGGRIFKNEMLKTAVLRKLREEVGLRGRVIKILGVHEYFSRTGYFQGTNSHTVPIVFLVDLVEDKRKSRLDCPHTPVGWTKH